MIEKSAPIQKEIRSDVNPAEIPSKAPIDKAILASPNPIHFPFETKNIIAKGDATKKDARSVGAILCGPCIIAASITLEKNDA